MELSVIIVNWNSVDYLMKCIESIVEQNKSVSYEIIVVDNASFDGCKEILTNIYPDVIFIQNEANLGFAIANNIGASVAKGFALLFLNPDTIVLDRAIESLYENLQKLPDAGILGCRLLNSDGSIQIGCVRHLPTPLERALDSDVLRWWFPNLNFWAEKKVLFSTQPVEVDAISGACMMIHSKTFRKVGGFTSNYFMYSEDIDLCVKVKRLGLKVYHVPKAKVIHYGGGSSGKEARIFSAVMMRISEEKYMRHNHGAGTAFLYRLLQALSALIRLQVLSAMICVSKSERRRSALFSFRKWLAVLKWALGKPGIRLS